MKQGDRLPALAVTAIKNDGTAYDLTGGSVVFNMRNAETGVVKVSRSAAILVDGPTGKLRYEWEAADLDTAGIYEADFEITISSRKLTVPTNGYIQVSVLDDIA